MAEVVAVTPQYFNTTEPDQKKKKKRSRPQKHQRARYHDVREGLYQMIERDPDGFDLDSVELPQFISKDVAGKQKLLRALESKVEMVEAYRQGTMTMGRNTACAVDLCNIRNETRGRMVVEDLFRRATEARLTFSSDKTKPGLKTVQNVLRNLSTNGDFTHMERELYNNEAEELRALRLHRQRQAAGAGSAGAEIVRDPADHSSSYSTGTQEGCCSHHSGVTGWA